MNMLRDLRLMTAERTRIKGRVRLFKAVVSLLHKCPY